MDSPQTHARAPPFPRQALRWLAAGAQWLLPARCLVCAEAGDAGLDLCAACRAALPRNDLACPRCALPMGLPAAVQLPVAARASAAAVPAREQWPSPAACATGPPAMCAACLQRPPPLDATWAAFLYAAPLDRLLPRYKFHGDLAAGRLLAQLMAQAWSGDVRPQALVPVPLHQARLRRRGYDQALELARPLATALDLPLRCDLLQRVRATAAQSQLDAASRRRNLRGAFRAGGRGLPAHVALVDDVMTTGATVHAAAEALRRAGVARVDAWVCARAA